MDLNASWWDWFQAGIGLGLSLGFGCHVAGLFLNFLPLAFGFRSDHR